MIVFLLIIKIPTTGSNLALQIITANDHLDLPCECTRLIAVDLFVRKTVSLQHAVSGSAAHNPLACVAEAQFYGALSG